MILHTSKESRAFARVANGVPPGATILPAAARTGCLSLGPEEFVLHPGQAPSENGCTHGERDFNISFAIARRGRKRDARPTAGSLGRVPSAGRGNATLDSEGPMIPTFPPHRAGVDVARANAPPRKCAAIADQARTLPVLLHVSNLYYNDVGNRRFRGRGSNALLGGAGPGCSFCNFGPAGGERMPIKLRRRRHGPAANGGARKRFSTLSARRTAPFHGRTLTTLRRGRAKSRRKAKRPFQARLP